MKKIKELELENSAYSITVKNLELTIKNLKLNEQKFKNKLIAFAVFSFWSGVMTIGLINYLLS